MQELTNINIKFRNFLSYGNAWTEVNFENGISTFIIGENHDTGSNNGCGKTSLLNAICYAIYNKPFDNISLPRLINSTNAAKNTLMEVIYVFKKDAEYTIHRKRGESHGVILTKDCVDITPDSVNETDALIERIYGISYEMFIRTIVFSGSSVPFLDLPVSQQRNHIEELFNISILSEKAVKLKKSIQTTESDIKVEEAIIKEKQTALKSYQKRLSDTEAKILNWEEQTTKQKENIKAKLKEIEGIDFDIEQKLFSESLELEKNITQIENQIASEKRSQTRAETELAGLKNEYDHLTKDNCPYCLQQMPNAKDKLKEISLKIDGISESDGIISIIKDFKNSIQESSCRLEVESNKLSEVLSQMKYDNLPALLETKSNVAVLENKLAQLEQSENPYLETYEEMLNEGLVEPDFNNLDKLKSRLEHQQFLLKLLTDKNSFIRRRIISKTIPFLNLQMNNYSKQIGLPHIIKFNDDMSCTVSEYERELDFGNLSAGEKKRVNLAMSLAFRDVLHHLHSKINLLFVDEIDASLCPYGVNDVIKLLKAKTKADNLSTWVIMHRPEAQGRFDRDLIVRKQNGFSRLEFKNIGEEL